jgi:hypothetical protein
MIARRAFFGLLRGAPLLAAAQPGNEGSGPLLTAYGNGYACQCGIAMYATRHENGSVTMRCTNGKEFCPWSGIDLKIPTFRTERA